MISVKLNIGKKITGLQKVTFNHQKMYDVSKFKELMFKAELHCLQECFRKQTDKEDV